ncbi:tRNA (adenosine(37)-N6)-threonylcarbamoyltransferase complex dimerization subunit type 1 TsaB [Sphingomonas sp. NBWT7]|uniref:tRNA (adenosine(37)-N6)-threonylcarbamoyltransferase complex dimerization subunit type 1 TsaB n=1 Tax=Sphingomonas sp. NBWT7 TaxID=2596913 RepID=UPI00162546CD|nr:tRNA (adenosine(37)-N6)-threonylcarbamoyltransferase complex dimerization subunit type 1 TsaB [Sphingomonas sp. NBWT7]QNE31692.1 tRNA (adenosine(37)-N6)-threonylcarbamoyltransferase complex dimerization subunit type 1 TsaB [Sphingomonas sp. NBWT7]
MSRMLVIETATAACSVALLENGAVIAARHEVVGRGHAERLVPMIAELPDGGRTDAILVDVGPGSFTGIRVGIAAARGLALGWQVPVHGYSSMSVVAAGALAHGVAGPLAVVLEGGHGEVFMQGFAASPLVSDDTLVSLRPEAAIAALEGRSAVGSGARRLLAIDSSLDVRDALPHAADVRLLPSDLTGLPPRPLYGRAPDAKLPA